MRYFTNLLENVVLAENHWVNQVKNVFESEILNISQLPSRKRVQTGQTLHLPKNAPNSHQTCEHGFAGQKS